MDVRADYPTESLQRLLSRYVRPSLQAALGDQVTLAGYQLLVPGSPMIRLSVAAGNVRFQRLCDLAVQPGAVVVDVGANIGYNTLYASHKAGPHGRVYALEPAQDNLAVLYANLLANHIRNVAVLPFAAGQTHELREFFLRGATSAVNSLYADNFYAPITGAVRVSVAPLDELIPGQPDLVKIDVEGAELEVLGGMRRILQAPAMRLIVEWHPILQQGAGYLPDALPRTLLSHGFDLYRLQGRMLKPVDAAALPALLSTLLRARRPVDLLAARPATHTKG